MKGARRNIPAIAVVTLAVVVAIAQLGPRLLPFEVLPGFPSGQGLDYDRASSGGLPALSEEFVARAFGRPLGSNGGPRGAVDGDGAYTPPTVPQPPQRTHDAHALTNDRIDDARAVTDLPYTARTDSSGAGAAGDPDACGATFHSVWYRFAARTGAGLVATTFGTRRPVTLGVFEGEGPGALQAVACSTDARGDAHIPFRASAGKTYYFMVADPIGGPVVFTLDPLGRTSRASVTTADAQSNDASGQAAISADGRYVAFMSTSRLAARDANSCSHAAGRAAESCPDVYVRDRLTGRTELISIAGDENASGNDASITPQISATGRYVVFTSYASNLVRDDTNDDADIFIRDRVRGTTERVTLRGSAQGDASEASPQAIPERAIYYITPADVSTDGRFVAFQTLQSLSRGDDDTEMDVYVRDRARGRTRLISRGVDGGGATGGLGSMSADGTWIAWFAMSDRVVEGDTNVCPNQGSGGTGCADVFLTERGGTTERISVSWDGGQANDASAFGAVSDDGRYVAFMSTASNLVRRGDIEGTEDVFVRDTLRDTTVLVSVDSNDDTQVTETQVLPLSEPGKDPPEPRPAISGDGRFVAFYSIAPLVPDDENNANDVFVRDLVTRTTTRVSVSSRGAEGDGSDDGSHNPSISTDGSVIAFSSWARLTPNDTNSCVDTEPHDSCVDVFVHELPFVRRR